MATVAQLSSYSAVQMTAWFRGLLSIAWADGNFDAGEQHLISELTQELAPSLDVEGFGPIDPEALAEGLGTDQKVRENFLRTAVMVALADGVYSSLEDQMLQQFCESLALDTAPLDALRLTLVDGQEENKPVTDKAAVSTTGISQPLETATADFPLGAASVTLSPLQPAHKGRKTVDVLKPARALLDDLEVEDPRLARFLCKLIPSQCPFERDVKLFGHKVVHIPPLCKLNPLYEQLVGLRFRALCYLADDLGEDVSEYC